MRGTPIWLTTLVGLVGVAAMTLWLLVLWMYYSAWVWSALVVGLCVLVVGSVVGAVRSYRREGLGLSDRASVARPVPSLGQQLIGVVGMGFVLALLAVLLLLAWIQLTWPA